MLVLRHVAYDVPTIIDENGLTKKIQKIIFYKI